MSQQARTSAAARLQAVGTQLATLWPPAPARVERLGLAHAQQPHPPGGGGGGGGTTKTCSGGGGGGGGGGASGGAVTGDGEGRGARGDSGGASGLGGLGGGGCKQGAERTRGGCATGGRELLSSFSAGRRRWPARAAESLWWQERAPQQRHLATQPLGCRGSSSSRSRRRRGRRQLTAGGWGAGEGEGDSDGGGCRGTAAGPAADGHDQRCWGMGGCRRGCRAGAACTAAAVQPAHW